MENINHEELQQAFLEIQMPRPPYVLDKMVVNARFTEEQKYAQCVLEMSIAYDNLRIARCNAELKKLELEEMDDKTPKGKLEKEKLSIELEQLDRARLGAYREFNYLYEMWQKFPKKYTRVELDNAQPLEYMERLKTQALQDMQATGVVSVGNLEGLRQIWLEVNMALGNKTVEQRYLEEGKLRVLLVVPTENMAIEWLPVLQWLDMPTNVELKVFNAWGKAVADNYNEAIEMAIREDCDYLLTIEDDQVLEKDTIIRLMDFALENKDACVGAWYPKRQKTRQGVHIIVKWGHRQFLNDDWGIHEVKTLAMGCSLYPVFILKKLDAPWCVTTNNITQDSYLTQKIRESGHKCLVNTAIKIGHKDRDGSIYY